MTYEIIFYEFGGDEDIVMFNESNIWLIHYMYLLHTYEVNTGVINVDYRKSAIHLKLLQKLNGI